MTPTEQSHFDLVMPVFDQPSDNPANLDKATAVLGIIVLHIDPHEFLVPYMALPPINTEIGKSFMMQITPKGLKPLALQNNPVKLKQALQIIPLLESQLAKFPLEGSFVADDFENQPFLVYQKMANTHWILVGMADGDEVFESLYQQLLWIFVMAVVVLFLIGWGLITQLAKQRLAQEAQALVKEHAKLEQSRQYFMGLFMDSPVPYQSLDANGIILEVNQAWENLFGYFKEEVVGQPYKTFITDDSLQSLMDNFRVLMAKGKVQDVPCKIVRKDREVRQVRLQGRISQGPDNQVRTYCSLEDVTQTLKIQAHQARHIQRTQALFDLMLHSPEMAETDLLQSALNELEGLTDSHISFVHFVNEDQNEIDLAAWSSQTRQKYCTAHFDQHYPVAKAGIWADCIRNREPIWVNDYASIAKTGGLPEGHSHLERLISVPIFHHQLVRMIVGVGNAEHDYDAFDVETVQLFGAELYQVILLKRTHDELLASELRFHNLFDQAPIAYQSLDAEGKIQEVNAAWLSLFGYQESQKQSLLQQPISDFLTDASKPLLQNTFATFLEQGYVDEVHFEIVRQDGTIREVVVTGRTSKVDGEGVRAHCMLVDVTEKNQTAQAIKLAAKVFESSGEGIMVTDSRQKIVTVNDAFTEILGFSKEDALGKSPSIIKSGKHDKLFYDLMWDSIQSKGIWQGVIWNRHKNGQLIAEWLTITTLRDDAGEIQNYIGVFANISKLKASEAELQFMSFHDSLTQLPNRNKFITQVEYAMTHSQRSQKPFAVLMLDLDRFKNVNDSYGHASGDEVLVWVAQQLLDLTREMDMVVRLGGDEFAVLMEELHQPEDAARLARKIIENISQPFNLSNGKVVSIGCSVGIALCGTEEVTPDQLIQQADTALYLAKQNGRGTFQYFTEALTIRAQERIAMEAELKNAIRNDELRVYFQPQVDLKSGQVKGAEALVRWQHPHLGLVMPTHFIPIAEESGFIAQLGAWVLQETCRQAKVWYDQGFTQQVYAVNVSPKQLMYSDILKLTMEALQANDLPAEVLELEITESGLLTVGKDEAVRLLELLRGLGVRIAIDDFGTGYSSLAYLKILPLDVLKIDKQFVDDIPNNEKGMQIVSTIIAMAHNLKLEVLAEGVENQQQADFLKFKGCDYYQGYLKRPPVDAETFANDYLYLNSKG